MAKYDLTARIAPNLDRHLVFPLLEFLQERQLYADEDILKAKIELLNHTNMVDYAMDIHKSLYQTEDVPQGTASKMPFFPVFLCDGFVVSNEFLFITMCRELILSYFMLLILYVWGVLDVDGKNFYSGRKMEIFFWGTAIFIQLM